MATPLNNEKASLTSAEDIQPVRTFPNNYDNYSSLNPFINEIRILILHGAKEPTAPVVCSLVRMTVVPELCEYEAISYCWGDPKNTAGMTVRHLDESTVLYKNKIYHKGQEVPLGDLERLPAPTIRYNVTKSLHSGLVEFRYRNEPRFLWADAICINQGNIAERSRQVSFMRVIYEAAARVLVWLDAPLDPNFDGIAMMHDILLFTEMLANKISLPLDTLLIEKRRSVESLRQFWAEFLLAYPDIPITEWTHSRKDGSDQLMDWLLHDAMPNDLHAESYHSHSVVDRNRLKSSDSEAFILEFLRSMKQGRWSPPHTLETFWNLDHFLARHVWFFRVWVLQEVGSNPNVIICQTGSRERWESLAAVEFIRYSLRAVVGFTRTWSIPFAWFRVTLGKRRERLTFLDLVGLTSKFHATDLRDNLFAIIGLVSELAMMERLPLSITPDYSKSVRQVFIQFTVWNISHQQSLDILSFASRCYRRWQLSQPDLPSWVPDYSQELPKLERTLGIFSQFQAGGRNRITLPADESDEVLCLEGFQIDIVSSVIEKDVRADNDWNLSCDDSGGVEVSAIPHLWRMLQSQIFSQSTYRASDALEKLNAERLHALLFQYVQCLTCAAPTEGLYINGHPLRAYPALEDALEACASIWVQNEPELRGLTWSQKDLWRRLSTQSPHRDWSWFRTVSGYSLLDRHLFTTSKSDFGLSPKGTKLNDIIVILYGGSTPYVLREIPCPPTLTVTHRPRDGPVYEFIGECYLGRHMHGSSVEKAGFAVDDHSEIEYPKKIFRIC
jgi:hypothetical protein